MSMITSPDVYFESGCGRCERFASSDCSTRQWQPGLLFLRRMALDVGLVETAKWGHPVYMAGGRNVAILGAFRADFRLTFFHSALLDDPEGVLERQGRNSRLPDCIRFTSNDEVSRRADVIRHFLLEATDHARRGVLPPKTPSGEGDLPEELVEALDADVAFAEAFHALTPGRRRGYLFSLNEAKASATRLKRIEKFRPLILAGRGLHDR